MKQDKVYVFKGKEKGIKYHIPEITLERAKIRAKRKWGDDVLISTGKVNKAATKERHKTRWIMGGKK